MNGKLITTVAVLAILLIIFDTIVGFIWKAIALGPAFIVAGIALYLIYIIAKKMSG